MIKPTSGSKLSLVSIHAIGPGKTVHIEGVSLNANGLLADVIRKYGNGGANIVVQNSHIGYQIQGSDFHSDCMQTQGVGHPETIKLQNLTCVPAGNGLQIPHSTLSYGGGNIGAYYYLLDRVNVRRWNNISGGNNINIGDCRVVRYGMQGTKRIYQRTV